MLITRKHFEIETAGLVPSFLRVGKLEAWAGKNSTKRVSSAPRYFEMVRDRRNIEVFILGYLLSVNY